MLENRFYFKLAPWLLCLTAAIAILALAGVATHHVEYRCWVKNTVPIKELTSWVLLSNALIGFLIARPDRRTFGVPIAIFVFLTVAMVVGLVSEISRLENLASYDPKASYFSSLAMAVGSVLLAARAFCALTITSAKPALCFSLSVFLLGACSLLGYALNVPAMYYFIPGICTALAIPTSVAFVLLGLLPIPTANV